MFNYIIRNKTYWTERKLVQRQKGQTLLEQASTAHLKGAL